MYWINTGVYNLDFKPFLPGLHDWKTVLGCWGIFNSILCYVICRVSSVKYWQCSNITIARGEHFQIQEVLCRIGYCGLLCMFRTVSNRQSIWNCPPDSILLGQFQILYRFMTTHQLKPCWLTHLVSEWPHN